MAGFPTKFDLAASHPRPAVRTATPFAPPAPNPQPEGFTPMADLLREMGLPPRVPPAAEAPLVAPHGADVAEFSPPRPLRRAATRFAHLPGDADD